jgi:hypothetical protein
VEDPKMSITRSTRKRTGHGESNRFRPTAITLLLAVGLLGAGFATPALALEAISPEAVEGGDGAGCSALTQAKYPWSNCGEGFAIGFYEGEYGEPPESQCRLYMKNGMCAATTEPWNGNYLGLKRDVTP